MILEKSNALSMNSDHYKAIEDAERKLEELDKVEIESQPKLYPAATRQNLMATEGQTTISMFSMKHRDESLASETEDDTEKAPESRKNAISKV